MDQEILSRVLRNPHLSASECEHTDSDPHSWLGSKSGYGFVHNFVNKKLFKNHDHDDWFFVLKFFEIFFFLFKSDFSNCKVFEGGKSNFL